MAASKTGYFPSPSPNMAYISRQEPQQGEVRIADLSTKSALVRALYEHWQHGTFQSWSDMLLEMVVSFASLTEQQGDRLLQYVQNTVLPIQMTVTREEISNVVANINNNSDAGKYGAVYNFEKKLKRDEPWFAIRGQDKLAPEALLAYMKLMADNGVASEDIRSVGLLVERIREWQIANPTKLPD